MKRILLFTLCLLYITPCFSQTQQENIMLVGTTSMIPTGFSGIFDGFIRVDKKKGRFDKDDPTSFFIGNSKAGFEVMLHHFNFTHRDDLPYLFIVDIDISDLKRNVLNAQIININDFFANKRKEEVWAWMLYHYLIGTNVWIVDYNSAYKSSDKLIEPDKVKAVQVRICIDNIPEKFREPYYSLYGSKD